MSAPTFHDESRRERFIAALLALGGFALLCAGVFLLPFALSPYAIQNDVYMSNLFLAPLIAFGGIVCLLIAAVGMFSSARPHSRRWLWLRLLVMAAVGAGVVTLASLVVGGRYTSYPSGAVNWPPYLNTPLLIVAGVTGVAVAIAGWRWGVGATGSGSPRAGHA